MKGEFAMVIKNIKLSNDYLPYNNLELNFLNGNGDLIRELLIFGRNGTGKSTIANTIDKYKDSDELNNELIIEYLSETTNKSKILIFNEGFIEKNIKFSENDNLKAIVMFDEQVNIENKIKRQNERLDKINSLLEDYSIRVDGYNEDANLSKVLMLLRGNGKWAERAILFEKGVKQNKRVDKNVLQEVLKHENTEEIVDLSNQLRSQIELINKFNDEIKLKKITKYSGFNEGLKKTIISVLNDNNDIKFTKNIDKNIEKIFEEYGNNYIQELDEYFKTKPNICKTCLRPLDDEYIQILREKLKVVFQNDLLEEKKQEITLLIQSIKEEIPGISLINIDASDINLIIEEVNKEIISIQEVLLRKSMNLNTVIEYDFKKYNELYEKLNYEVEKINTEIEIYNNEIDRLSEHKKKYNELNYKIAYQEIKYEYNNFKKTKEDYSIYSSKVEKCTRIKQELECRIRKLKVKQAQTSIALKMMNRELALIFFDKERLVLSGESEHYEILVRGKNIPLCKLSTGEKNVLALVYFFSLLNTEKKINEMYSDNYFLILDDPISSFDFENKIGIYNYLRKQFKLLYMKNQYSQIVLTTHDMEAYYNFEKVFQDIVGDDGKKLINKVNKYILTENGLVNDKKNQVSNIYNSQMKLIFEFAKGNKNEVENYIGNTMRRVCEAFSTFKYKCGIDFLRTDNYIIDLINESNLREFFENYLFRLILNNESHHEDDYKGITDKDIMNYLTLNEKIKTAKLVILFLYKLDKLHILKQLSNDNNIDEIDSVILQWEQEVTNIID